MARSVGFLMQLRITAGSGTAYSGLGWSLIKKMSPTDLPIGQPDEDDSPIAIPTFQTTLVCIKCQKKIACIAHGQDDCGNENDIIHKSESEKITSQNCLVHVCHSGA